MYNGSLKPIYKHAVKRYPDSRIDGSTYSSLAKSIKKAQQKEDKSELRYSIEQEIQYIENHKLTDFLSIRLGIYGYVLAIVVFVVSNLELAKNFGISNPKTIINYFIWFGIILFPALWITTFLQNNRLVFLRFELECLILNDNNKK